MRTNERIRGEETRCPFSDAFLSALEKDAAERAERNRKNKILADEWKSKGNDAFHRELYDEAIGFYTEVRSNSKRQNFVPGGVFRP